MASAYDFNKEEEVKEFLDNLGIEYRFNCFNEKIPESKYWFESNYIFIYLIL